jgi:hypothetical protein
MAAKPKLPEAWKGPKMPSTLGECVDAYGAARQRRLDLEKEAEAAQSAEHALRDHLAKKFKWAQIDGAKGSRFSVSVSKGIYATLKDPLEFFKWVAKTKSFDLLHKRCSDEAARLRWEKGVSIPGVEKFEKHKLNVSTIKK